MNEKYFKFGAIIFFIIVVWAIFAPSSDKYNVNITSMASDGLDLQALGPLMKKAKDAKDLEKLLNDKDTGINNLDLNEDDKVDYIKVTEYGAENARGFSLTVDVADGEEQEIATVELEKTSEKEATAEVHGNSHIYGHNSYYHSRYSIGNAMLFSYFFRPHPFYVSPYHWGYYPSYYGYYRPVSMGVYRTRVRSNVGASSMRKSSASSLKSKGTKSPNSGKSSSRIKAPLKNPSTSQKSFQKRNPSRQVKSGGFGRSGSSVRRSGSSRSGGFFGGK